MFAWTGWTFSHLQRMTTVKSTYHICQNCNLTFWWRFVLLLCVVWIFCWYKGVCHRNEWDLLSWSKSPSLLHSCFFILKGKTCICTFYYCGILENLNYERLISINDIKVVSRSRFVKNYRVKTSYYKNKMVEIRHSRMTSTQNDWYCIYV